MVNFNFTDIIWIFFLMVTVLPMLQQNLPHWISSLNAL